MDGEARLQGNSLQPKHTCFCDGFVVCACSSAVAASLSAEVRESVGVAL